MVSRLIEFFYLGDYPSTKPDLTSAHEKYEPWLETIAAMHSLGDKYDVQGLQQLSMEKFQTVFSVKKYRPTEIPCLLCAIHTVYTMTQNGNQMLRDIVLAEARQNWSSLTARGDFKDFMLRNPSFTVDVVDKLMWQPSTIICRRGSAVDKWKPDHMKCSCEWDEKIQRRCHEGRRV